MALEGMDSLSQALKAADIASSDVEEFSDNVMSFGEHTESVNPTVDASSSPEVHQTPGPSAGDLAAKGYSVVSGSYSSKPCFPNQIQDESLSEGLDVQAVFLDLKSPEDAKKYQDILAGCSGVFQRNVLIKEENRDFDWCKLLIYQPYRFKQLIKVETKEL
jgi:hypothetical protein